MRFSIRFVRWLQFAVSLWFIASPQPVSGSPESFHPNRLAFNHQCSKSDRSSQGKSSLNSSLTICLLSKPFFAINLKCWLSPQSWIECQFQRANLVIQNWMWKENLHRCWGSQRRSFSRRKQISVCLPSYDNKVDKNFI